MMAGPGPRALSPFAAASADVQEHAAGILERLRNGTMPCDGAWLPEKIEVLNRWTESGFHA